MNFRLEHGFTLIELLLVISLLSLFSTIIAPNFKQSLKNYKLEVAAQELAQNLRLAQQKAISEGVSCKVMFDLHWKNNYQVTVSQKGKIFYLPSGVFFEWTNLLNKSVIFYPTGAPNQAGTIAMNNENKRLYVIIAVATGRVRVGKTQP